MGRVGVMTAVAGWDETNPSPPGRGSAAGLPAVFRTALPVPPPTGARPGPDGSGEVEDGGGEREEITNSGGDAGPGVHLCGSHRWCVVRGGRSVLTPPSVWSPTVIELCATVRSSLVAAGEVRDGPAISVGGHTGAQMPHTTSS